MFLDLYGKKARFSLMMLMYFDMPLSYHTAATASSGMARALSSEARRPPGGAPVVCARGGPRTCSEELFDNSSAPARCNGTPRYRKVSTSVNRCAMVMPAAGALGSRWDLAERRHGVPSPPGMAATGLTAVGDYS